MISRSIYICSRKESLESVLGELGITPTNILSYEENVSYLETKENGALVEQVRGDFTHAVDFDLFDRGLRAVISVFRILSKRGVEVAMPVEEEDDPFVFHLWRDGRRLLVRVEEDEDNEDTILILDPLSDAGLQ